MGAEGYARKELPRLTPFQKLHGNVKRCLALTRAGELGRARTISKQQVISTHNFLVLGSSPSGPTKTQFSDLSLCASVSSNAVLCCTQATHRRAIASSQARLMASIACRRNDFHTTSFQPTPLIVSCPDRHQDRMRQPSRPNQKTAPGFQPGPKHESCPGSMNSLRT